MQAGSFRSKVVSKLSNKIRKELETPTYANDNYKQQALVTMWYNMYYLSKSTFDAINDVKKYYETHSQSVE